MRTQLGHNARIVVVLTVAVLGISLFALAQPKAERWVLPVADGSEEKPSPPSVHGYIADTSGRTVTVRPDRRDANASTPVTVRLTPKTEFFTAFGGPYEPKDLRSGQYVWVWYITADPKQAGTPPRAAVVLLWSEDPTDKPSRKDRFSYDRPK